MMELFNKFDWQLLFSFFVMAIVFLMFLSILLLRLTLDIRIRRHGLPKDWEYIEFLDQYFGIGRAMLFGMCCVLPHVNNAPMYRRMYNDIDVEAFANWYEKLLGFCMTISTSLLSFTAIFYVLTDFLGLIEW